MLQYYMASPFDNHWGMYWGLYIGVVQVGWSIFDNGGAFGERMTDILTHEFGHARGAIDIYYEHVPAENNPVNGIEFPYDSTIMGTTYYARIWDEYSYNVINRNADIIFPPLYFLREYFPDTIGLSVQSFDRLPIADARVKVYTVRMRTFSVNPSPIIDAFTDENGKLVFGINPYQPKALNIPPFIANFNLLITVKKGSSTTHNWLTLADVQTSYFNDSTASMFSNIIMDDIVLYINEIKNLATTYQLSQNYPNPFNPTTTISFSLSKNSFVKLEILNVIGQSVKKLVHRQFKAGTHMIEWDGTNRHNQKVSSGIYYYRFTTDEQIQTKKMLLLK